MLSFSLFTFHVWFCIHKLFLLVVDLHLLAEFAICLYMLILLKDVISGGVKRKFCKFIIFANQEK